MLKLSNFSYTDKVTLKILLITSIAIFAIPYYFIAGGSLLGFILIRLIAFIFADAGQIGNHRWLCHNSFEPSRFGRYMMLAGLLFSGIGRPLHVVIAHRLHHANTDNEIDPHSPKYRSFLDLWLGKFTISSGVKVPKDFFRKKDIVWFNNNYWFLYFSFNILLAFIDLKTALIFCPITLAQGWIINTIINYHGHKDSDGNIQPRNLNSFITFISAGEGLHANHHENPSNYSLEGNGRKDTSLWLVNLLMKKS